MSSFLQYVLPYLAEFSCLIPLFALPFVYWVGHSKPWVEYFVLVHILVVVLLTGLAMTKTGSTDPGRWERFLRYRVYDAFLYFLLLYGYHCTRALIGY